MRLFIFIKLVVSFIRFGQDPTRTADALRVANSLRDLRLLQTIVPRVSETPEARALIQARTGFQIPPLENLGKLPEGTLGRAYYQHMTANGLSPDFYTPIAIEDDASYIMMRMRGTHDLWHTVTGFGTSVADEVALLAFMIAQVRTPLSALLIAGALIKTAFKDHTQMVAVTDGVSRGWRMGTAAKDLFAFDWNGNWATPLSEVRSRYSIGGSYLEAAAGQAEKSTFVTSQVGAI